MIYFLFVLGVIVLSGYFLLKYLNGDYSFEDEIIDEYFTYRLKDNSKSGKMFIIKRTYLNGKIDIIKKIIEVN